MSESNRIGRFTGSLDPDFDLDRVQHWLTRLPQVHDLTLISKGRDLVYRAEMPGPEGPVPVAVKSYGPERRWKNRVDRSRGSRSKRAHQIAVHVTSMKGPVMQPVAHLESWENDRLVEHYQISRFHEDSVTFREALLYHYEQDPHCGRIMDLLQVVASGVRRLHDCGVEHRDLGNQNILLQRVGNGVWRNPRIVDLHRGRITSGLTPEARGRDCSRICLPSDLLRVFLQMMDAPEVLPEGFLDAQKSGRKRYQWRSRTRKVRHPLRDNSGPDRDYPAEPDIWIWDDRSEQAIPAIGGKDKRKYYRRSDGLQIIKSVVPRYSPVRRAYHELKEQAWQEPVEMRNRIGVAVRVDQSNFETERGWLQKLGRIPVLVRLYHHVAEEEQLAALEAVRKLGADGHPVSIAFVQDRKAILQPRKWAAFVERAAGALSGTVESAEVGHAVNRVKWGVWNFEEYRKLLTPFADWEQRFPQLPLTGPAGIDFEYHRVLPLLDLMPKGMRYSALSHHLYVDRRGAPENFQGKFDTLGKLALARAMARVHPLCDDRLVVSEVNWPVAGTGVWSPVGSPYESPGPRHGDPSVDEATYADYMRRYYLIALCSGMADRVMWWSLAAHGFGLIDDRDPEGWRARPAFHALQQLLQETEGARYLSRTDAGAYRFERAGESFELPG